MAPNPLREVSAASLEEDLRNTVCLEVHGSVWQHLPAWQDKKAWARSRQVPWWTVEWGLLLWRTNASDFIVEETVQDRCADVSCSRSLAAAVQKTAADGEAIVVQSRRGSSSILIVSSVVTRSNVASTFSAPRYHSWLRRIWQSSRTTCGTFQWSQWSAIAPKRCKVGSKLVLITNRKSYMSFRLVPKSVTLNDLDQRNGPYFYVFFTQHGSFRVAKFGFSTVRSAYR